MHYFLVNESLEIIQVDLVKLNLCCNTDKNQETDLKNIVELKLKQFPKLQISHKMVGI